tara:strand:- start:2100 stop:2285 length:186 start_codon:yes stop_codon:yes gene_type:complete
MDQVGLLDTILPFSVVVSTTFLYVDYQCWVGLMFLATVAQASVTFIDANGPVVDLIVPLAI